MTKGVAFAEGPSTFTRVLPLRSLPLSAFHRTFVTSIICTRPDLCLPPHRTRVAEEGLFPSFSDKLPPTSQLQQSIGAGQKIFSLFAFLLRCRGTYSFIISRDAVEHVAGDVWWIGPT
ncbi:hypothetical protein GBA52_012917 [Prunus armeniaca]|nr:hypothetical protein GBA52_012917 [Prunus armeniaca]